MTAFFPPIRRKPPLLLWLAAGLALAAPGHARCITDDTATEVCAERPPRRIVSLYGAYTELLWEMGVGERIVARTKNDTTVAQVAALPSVGSGLRPNVEYLLALRPDLVVGRASRASGDTLAALRARDLPVAAFDPRGLGDLYGTIRRLGVLCDAEGRAEALIGSLEGRLTAVRTRVGARERPLRVVYEVRADPLTVAGADGLVNELIAVAGGVNAVAIPKKIAMLDVEALLRLDPDVYVVQRGPMNRNPPPPAERPHLATLRAVREGRVLVVDERLFSRPGPRVAEAAEQLSRFLYPEQWQP
ncbi:MAG: ABC transporter substrate-binding protein [Deferrisomatales bacterium]